MPCLAFNPGTKELETHQILHLSNRELWAKFIYEKSSHAPASNESDYAKIRKEYLLHVK